jgi:hypothetical protein
VPDWGPVVVHDYAELGRIVHPGALQQNVPAETNFEKKLGHLIYCVAVTEFSLSIG